MISIRYKALAPMIFLAVVLLTLAGAAVYALAEILTINRSLASRYDEIEEVRKIEVAVSMLTYPHVAYLESYSAEPRTEAETLLADIDAQMRALRALGAVNAEERALLDYVHEQIVQVRVLSNAFFSTPASGHSFHMAVLHELSTYYLATLSVRLLEWHSAESRQVDELVHRAEDYANGFYVAAMFAGVLAAALFLLALWLHNRMLVRPLLDIGKSTAGIADGHLEQHVAVHSNDELGRLAQDINRMAESLQNTYKRLEQLANNDALTGLLNRRAFEQIAARELQAAQRYQRKLGIVTFDIDHFKFVNDTHGHAIGDEIIKFVAQRCVESLRAGDVCFRVGGEEFVLLIQEADAQGAVATAERCRRALEELAWSRGDLKVGVTASFGVACYPQDGESLDLLLKHSDLALYAAKHAGRNRVLRYQDLEQRAAG